MGASFDTRAGGYMDQSALGKATLPAEHALKLHSSLAPLRLNSDKYGRLKPGDESPGMPSPAPTPGARTLFAGRVDKLYLVLVSMHGLIRGENMELGRDADTGGQVGSFPAMSYL